MKAKPPENAFRIGHLLDRAEKLADRAEKLAKTSKAVHVPYTTHQRLAVAAQTLGLSGPDQLAAMALNAVLDLYTEEKWLYLPLMLSQVAAE